MFFIRIKISSFFILTCLLFSSLAAQSSDSTLLTLDRIYKNAEFRSERFGPARWLEDGSGYTTLEKSESLEKGRDIVKYDAETGERSILVSAEKLIPENDTLPLEIANYKWSSKGSILLIFTNTKRVWRTNTRGDYWVLNLKNRELQQLGKNFKPSTLMFAKISPDEKKAAYVQENNIYVEDISSHKITQITKDGSTTIINGTFDWVYEEEFDCRDGFRWSPDSKKIAYWQLDAEGVGKFYMINNTDSLYSKIIPLQYPKAGTTNSACKVGVVNASGGSTTWLKVPGDPRENYIPRMEWADNSKEIILQYMNRLQNTNNLMIGEAKTGKIKTILTEQDSAWLDVVNDLKWMEKGIKFTWVSERDGWRHVYLVSRNGKKMKLITRGKYDVISIEKIDNKGGWLYFIASPDNPAQRYLYRTRLNGKGRAQKLSPKKLPGTHKYQISQDGKWAIHSYSTFETPRSIDLISLPEHKSIRPLAANKKTIDRVKTLKVKPVEFFKIKIEENTELDGWMMKPYNFDESKKYPVLFFVYGEPAGQRVVDRFYWNHLWHLMLTQQGYIVICVDNRGTPAPKGREWRKCVYEKVGTLTTSDQAKAALKIREWSFVDSTRIAIWGWSGGGSMTLNALFRYPNIYKTGMSVAPVPDQRYYDTIYQERYLGLPTTNAEVYKQCSPINFAQNLEGNLLIVHGTGDDNVHYQGTEALINKLIEYNKHFTMMAYPNRSHGIYEGPNTTRHLFYLLTRYLNENMPAGGK